LEEKTMKKAVSYIFATIAGLCFVSGVAVLSSGREKKK